MSCSKVCYISRKDARAAMRWLRQRRGLESGHAYRCRYCSWAYGIEIWHLSTMSRERAKRDEKARKERYRARTWD
jgi:hypothetical protein